MDSPKHDSTEIRKTVRNRYAGVARTQGSCCSSERPREAGGGCCCTPAAEPDASTALGYSAAELAALPEGADLGLGCGNPQAVAALVPGETVVDLGSGGGIDCFLAAQQVGPAGQVIGVDMTPEMIELARTNAAKAGLDNVSFRLGEIEHLPVADASVDAIISNCVINLSPDKPAVYADAFRVLKPGGRVAISDVVTVSEMPEALRHDSEMLSGCVAGAPALKAVETMLIAAGFEQVNIELKTGTREVIARWAPGTGIENYLVPAHITAVKPLKPE